MQPGSFGTRFSRLNDELSVTLTRLKEMLSGSSKIWTRHQGYNFPTVLVKTGNNTALAVDVPKEHKLDTITFLLTNASTNQNRSIKCDDFTSFSNHQLAETILQGVIRKLDLGVWQQTLMRDVTFKNVSILIQML